MIFPSGQCKVLDDEGERVKELEGYYFGFLNRVSDEHDIDDMEVLQPDLEFDFDENIS